MFPINSYIFVNLLQILAILPIISSGPDTDYCTITCNGHKHTVCERNKRCGPLPPCVVIDSTEAFRAYMLDQHNSFRNDIASGKNKGAYGNTGAKNMNALSYDLELEYIAACWVNSCQNIKHDKCRNSERFMVGQNIWQGSGEGMNGTTGALKGWFGEIDKFTDATWLDKFSKSNYPKDKYDRGHFTQSIWAETKYVGCAQVKFGETSNKFQLLCNYGPSGNVNTMPIYKRAKDASEIASECKGGKNTRYTSLCGQINPVPTESMWSGNSQLYPISYLINLCILLVYCHQSL